MTASTARPAFKVGTRFELRLPPVTRTTLALFAGGSGDHNAIHIDLDAAREAGFDDVFAQGMLGGAYVGRLLCEQLGQERVRSLDLRFTAITPVLAQPTVTAEVSAVRTDEAELQLAVVLADGTTTITGSAVVTV